MTRRRESTPINSCVLKLLERESVEKTDRVIKVWRVHWTGGESSPGPAVGANIGWGSTGAKKDNKTSLLELAVCRTILKELGK